MRRDEIHAAFHMAVSEELRRADAQHSDAADIYEMLAVLGEEFGELQQAVLDYDYHGGTRDHVLKECIQVGAMACKTFRFIQESLRVPRGHTTPGAERLRVAVPADDGMGGGIG